jgi:hypothetical protein
MTKKKPPARQTPGFFVGHLGGNKASPSTVTSTQLPTARRTAAVPLHMLGHFLVAHLTALSQLLAPRLMVLLPARLTVHLLAPILATLHTRRSDRLNKVCNYRRCKKRRRDVLLVWIYFWCVLRSEDWIGTKPCYFT